MYLMEVKETFAISDEVIDKMSKDIELKPILSRDDFDLVVTWLRLHLKTFTIVQIAGRYRMEVSEVLKMLEGYRPILRGKSEFFNVYLSQQFDQALINSLGLKWTCQDVYID